MLGGSFLVEKVNSSPLKNPKRSAEISIERNVSHTLNDDLGKLVEKGFLVKQPSELMESQVNHGRNAPSRSIHALANECPETGNSYCFRNSLTQEAAYSMLLHQNRRKLHSYIAEYLEGEVETQLTASDQRSDSPSLMIVSRGIVHSGSHKDGARRRQ